MCFHSYTAFKQRRPSVLNWFTTCSQKCSRTADLKEASWSSSAAVSFELAIVYSTSAFLFCFWYLIAVGKQILGHLLDWVWIKTSIISPTDIWSHSSVTESNICTKQWLHYAMMVRYEYMYSSWTVLIDRNEGGERGNGTQQMAAVICAG